jgi:hypothetical protein
MDSAVPARVYFAKDAMYGKTMMTAEDLTNNTGMNFRPHTYTRCVRNSHRVPSYLLSDPQHTKAWRAMSIEGFSKEDVRFQCYTWTSKVSSLVYKELKLP